MVHKVTSTLMVQGRHLTPSISLSPLHDGHLYLIGTGIFFLV
jgi:hypothetical protein